VSSKQSSKKGLAHCAQAVVRVSFAGMRAMLRTLIGQKPPTSLMPENYRETRDILLRGGGIYSPGEERTLLDEKNGRGTCVTGGAKLRNTS